MPRQNQPYRDGQGTCLTCGGPCDVRAKRCRDCTKNATHLVCPGCNQTVPREDMTSPSGRRLSYCPPCLAEWHRNNRYVKKYGITSAEYDRLLAAQDGVCAICGTGDEGRGRDFLHVDHCHKTGKVRGLLCFHCNAGIGHFKDETWRLRNAADYVQQHTS